MGRVIRKYGILYPHTRVHNRDCILCRIVIVEQTIKNGNIKYATTTQNIHN